MVIGSIPLRCSDCGTSVPRSVENSIQRTGSQSILDAKTEKSIEFWWCRDCLTGVCKRCHLLKGHTEHRANEWKAEEIYRACVQALEGRCSQRSKQIQEQRNAVKEFIAKALTSMELLDERPSIYHVPSPCRPAWKTWNLDQEDPEKMSTLIENASELLHLPREESYEDEEIILKDRSEWNARQAAEMVAKSLGARITVDNSSIYSRTDTPDHKSWPDSISSERRTRGSSVDSNRKQIPLEPNVFVRDRPSVMSFRERSVPSEGGTFNDSLGSPVLSHVSFDSKPGSVMSSLPMYPCDQSLGSATSSASQAVTPTPAVHLNGDTPLENGLDHNGQSIPNCFGSSYLTRPICVQAFNTKTRKNTLAVSDSCGGVYITDRIGRVQEEVQIKNSSASSVAIDEKNDIMYVSVMQSKGRSIHVFDIANKFKKLDVISCPKDPKIEMSRTRWLTVAPRGQLFMVSGDNVKSALWCYVRGRKGWKTLKESRKTRYQYLSVAEDQADYKAVVLLTCDACNNRLLLFVVDHSLSLINEYDLSKTYRLPEHIQNPASAIVDGHGNLLILDYATGKLWILLSGVKGIRRLKEIHFEPAIQAQEALGITVLENNIYVACFGSREIRMTQYLEEGVFRPAIPNSNRSPSLGRRSASLPRPPESAL